MTLIATLISLWGIIQAADSNITSANRVVGHADKVFALAFAPGAVAVAGSFTVGGQAMDVWMASAIANYEATTAAATLGRFADNLRERLDLEMRPVEKQRGTLIHVAGYATGDRGSYPEFHFVRNVQGIDAGTGAYTGFGGPFVATEDFWGRDYLLPGSQASFSASGCWMYFNGFPDGRSAYLGLHAAHHSFLAQVWQDQRWNFRPPQSLDELAMYVDLELRTVSTMFVASDYPVQCVGGSPRVWKVASPPDAASLTNHEWPDGTATTPGAPGA